MASKVFIAPHSSAMPGPVTLKRHRPKLDPNEENTPRKRPTKADFSTFCAWVLEYEAFKKEEAKEPVRSPSPLDSEGSSVVSGSEIDDATNRTEYRHGDLEKGEDWHVVTCYCGKPFSGRPMIECSKCATWVHLSCAKVRKTNVPDVFLCQKCRDAKKDIRRSHRQREPKKQFRELYEDK